MQNLIINTVFLLIALAVSPGIVAAFQEEASSKFTKAAESTSSNSLTTPEWWLEAVEKISYPDKLALQTELMKTRFEAEAALDSMISQATREFFGNYLSQRDLEEISSAKDLMSAARSWQFSCRRLKTRKRKMPSRKSNTADLPKSNFRKGCGNDA
jgi:hypothetical protein